MSYNNYRTARRRSYMSTGKYRRQNAFMVNRFTPVKTMNTQGTTRSYVPRSLGNPLAVTERKYFDTEQDTTVAAISSSWASAERDPTTYNTLFCPVTGDDFNNRTGRKVHIVSIKIRGKIYTNGQSAQTTPDIGSLVRLLLVQDTQTNGSQLNAEDVISSGGTNGAISMYQNPAYLGRFNIIKDKKFTLSNVSMTNYSSTIVQAGITRYFNISINFKKPRVVHFNATNGGTVADIIDNSFHIICATDNNAIAPYVQYKSRFVFVDA